MKLKTVIGNEEITVMLKEISSEKKLKIRIEELKKKNELISSEDVIAEITVEAAEFYHCSGLVKLDVDETAKKLIEQIAADNRNAF